MYNLIITEIVVIYICDHLSVMQHILYVVTDCSVYIFLARLKLCEKVVILNYTIIVVFSCVGNHSS